MSVGIVCVLFVLISGLFPVIAQNTNQTCGLQASENQYPWLVGIVYYRIECTGALIDDRHVVTRAMCFRQGIFQGVAKSVRLGPYNAITGDSCFGDIGDNNCTDIGAIRIPIEVTIIHPEYDLYANWPDPHKDIALIRLKEAVEFTDDIRPICLPQADVTLSAADRELYITGLLFQPYNQNRRQIHNEKSETGQCILIDKTVADDDICTKNVDNITSCLRTGGLLVNKRRDRYELVGLLEQRSSCAPVKVFNHLYPHIDWIQNELRKWKHGCGKRKVKHVELIMNGETTKAGDWPWHVAIYRMKKYICGGTLISKTLVLTAAHCVTIAGIPADPEIFSVFLEKFYLVGADSVAQERQVHSVIAHEKFTQKHYADNDIALLKLKTEAIYNDYVQPACVWSSEAYDRLPSNSDFGMVVGWGFAESETLSSQLKQANLPIVPDVTCIMRNPMFYANALGNNKKFCAGWANGTSTCNGDSGGGLFMFVPDKAQSDSNAPGSWYIRGIVSVSVALRNFARCDPYQYVVFTDVAKYSGWIERHLVNELKNKQKNT